MIALRKIDTNPDKQCVRKFATMLLLGLPVSGMVICGIAYFIQGSFSLTPFYIFCSVAILAFAFSFVSMKAGRAIHVTWHALSAAIEWILSLVSLVVMYYVVIVPIALIMKIARRRSPLTGLNRDKPSYWIDNNVKRDLSSYFRQY